jgi:hypothetical protein
LAEDLKAVRRVGDVSEAHTARIAAKRLRYLLEPVSRRVRGIKTLVGRLKELQDVLGDLRDRQVLADEIASSLAALAQSRPDRASGPQAGLLALQGLANEHAAASFAEFDARWTHDHATRFFRRADDLGSELVQADANEVGQGNKTAPVVVRVTPSPVGDPALRGHPDLSGAVSPKRRLLLRHTSQSRV